MDESNEKLIGVTKDVVEIFISELERAELPKEVVIRLRETLIVDGKRSEKALLAAIFPESHS